MSLLPTTASRRLLPAASLALLLAACGSPSVSPTVSPIPPSGSPGASGAPSGAPSGSPSASPAAGAPGLLLEVTSEGGFINPLATLSAVPAVVVDTDGRIYTPAASATSVSIVAPVQVRDVGPQGAARILDAIRAAGLDHEQSGGGVAADTGSTVFTAVVDGSIVVSRFVRAGGGPGGPGGPGMPGGPGGPGASGSADDGASAAFALLAQLTDPTVTWGAAAAPETDYAPVGYRVFEAPAGAVDPAAATIAWPLGTGLAGFGAPAVPDMGTAGLRTGVVTGADAALLAPVLATATPDTVFTSGGTAYRLWVRPLFPDALGG